MGIGGYIVETYMPLSPNHLLRLAFVGSCRYSIGVNGLIHFLLHKCI